MSTQHPRTDVAVETLKGLSKGTVITITDPSTGDSFTLEAEGRTFNDFILHGGTPPSKLAGLRSTVGKPRTYWTADRLVLWQSQDRCRIELTPGKQVQS